MPIFDIHAYLEGFVLPEVNQHASQVIKLMQERGIERTALMSVRAAQADPLSGNRIMKAMLEQGPGLYGVIVAHLNRVDASVQAIKDLLQAKKFIGVLMTSTDPNAPLHPIVADEVLNACRRYQKPVFIHTPNADCVAAAHELAMTYNMHKFIFLGMGGHDWRTAIAAARKSVNIFLETSGSLDRMKIAAAIESIGSHRILFGSGMPHIDPAAALGLIEDSDLIPNDKRRILHDNAAKLFNIEEIENGL